MPGNLLDADISFPELRGKDQSSINKEIIDYLYMLLETLKYSYRNIGIENFNETEFQHITELIQEPLYTRISDAEGNLTELSVMAEGLVSRVSDAEGNITVLTQTSEAFAGRLGNAEGDLTELSATAKGLMTRMESAEGDLVTLSGTAAGLLARIQDAEGNLTELSAVASGLQVSVTDLSAGMGHTLRLGADGMTVYDANGRRVIISNGNLNLDGAITWNEISDDVERYINATAYTASDALTAAGSALSAAESAQGTIDQWSYKYGGNTYIDGEKLMTDTVTASKLKGGEVTLLDSTGTGKGYFNLAPTTTGIGMELYTYAGMRLLAGYGNLHLQAVSTGLTVYGADDGNGTRVQVDGGPLISGNGYTLGTAQKLWGAVYSSSGSIQTSDATRKNSIEDLPEKYTEIFDRLRAVRYKYDDGTSNRYHVGFIAQEVKAAMDAAGVDSLEFGGYVADVDENSNPIFMLRYEEIFGILWAKVRELDARMKLLVAAA